MIFKKGDIVTVSNMFEEYMGTALILYKDEEKIDIKIIDEQTGLDVVPGEEILLKYENDNTIFAAYCNILKRLEESGALLLRVKKTFSVINRRFSTRYPAFFKVSISPLDSEQVFEGVIKNMSLRGFMVTTDAELSVNDLVKMGLEYDGRIVELKARIIRKSGQDGNYIYGLCIVDLGYDEKLLLRSIITELKEEKRKLSEKIIREYIGNDG
ncbi:PilZ domain-containing protein [Acetivibrio clariflavus]|uniref:PilZ domain-containing protein n=1 Tax=Acetivibrio clariflavus (strain DSM 19732 / NBRC 101661 / EBR45) TaxID=720554 RepID=G8LX55_ACECE|nr:PilZ domain-containing protein [Acetivibrio clariflavus]AEV68746.1 PilZ domain-containing protein [Acetivibrio clariflavus DSM 19732]